MWRSCGCIGRASIDMWHAISDPRPTKTPKSSETRCGTPGATGEHAASVTQRLLLFLIRSSTMSKVCQQKYYAVRNGRQGPQIYSSWEEAWVYFVMTSMIAQYDHVSDDPIDQSERESSQLMRAPPNEAFSRYPDTPARFTRASRASLRHRSGSRTAIQVSEFNHYRYVA